jgi:hypothetical protein
MAPGKPAFREAVQEQRDVPPLARLVDNETQAIGLNGPGGDGGPFCGAFA